MNHPLDKIFRDKLADHSLPAPESAWSKVAAATAKKNSVFGMYRIAAGLLLLCAVTAVLVWLMRPNTETVLASSKTTASKDPSTSSPVVPAIVKSAVPAVNRGKKKSSPPRGEVRVDKTNLAEVQQASPEKAQEPAEAKGVPQPEVVKTESLAVAAPVEKAVVIEYRLEPVVTGTLNTTAAQKEKTGLRKVLDFALDSNPLGELRDAKDNLFAFNFKKEKQNNPK